MGFFDAPVSGMDTFQQMMNIVGNNISNANTVGYKSSEVNFADMLSQTIKSGSAGSATGLGGTNPQQVGLGVTMGAVTPIFTQGSLTQTGTPSDLAIDGSGFIPVSATQTPTSTSQVFYTRAGDFQVDSNGNLVTSNGYYVMGLPTSSVSTLPSSSLAASSLKAINLDDASGNPAQYTIGQDGLVSITGGPATTYTIPLVNFQNPDGLDKSGNNIYQSPTGGNSGVPTFGQAGTGDFGAINQGFLESSNVDLTRELSNMLIAQTGYSSNSKVISTQNQMFQSLIQNV